LKRANPIGAHATFHQDSSEETGKTVDVTAGKTERETTKTK
jgi:hypothetical protein